MSKLYLIVNSSLKMKPGKIVAQTGHAIVSIISHLENKPSSEYKDWLNHGQPIITKKCAQEDMLKLLDLYQYSAQKYVKCFPVHDAGKTQVPAGSLTVI